MQTQTLRFLRRGQVVTVHDVPPERTVLELLREDLGCTGTKEGCGEGDCGACTVVLGQAQPSGNAEHSSDLHLSAINSCIRLAHSINGMALWTVEDLNADPHIRAQTSPQIPPQTTDQASGQAPAASCSSSAGAAHCASHSKLHPAQQAMVNCHGSQCGFCTPGFVMSMFGLYENHSLQGQKVDRPLAQEVLSGNLCRCTGYRPILDAAQQMSDEPAMALDRQAVLQKLKLLELTPQAQEASLAQFSGADAKGYLAPTTLADLLAARAAAPKAQIVAGCTDVGLWITKMHKQFGQILDVTRVAELQSISTEDGHLRIGAGATLTESFKALNQHWPQLHSFSTRFAGMPVRNSGTLGGNVANGSPIGDSMPLLIALNAQIVLASTRGERSLPLEDFYTGYRQNVLAADELVTRLDVPLPRPQQVMRAYKISKRFDDDISAVCLVISLDIAGCVVQRASIGAGGVAATPVRATEAETLLIGNAWNEAQAQAAGQALQAQFKPISDMRASSAYRSTLLANLMQRFWLESSQLNEQQTAPASLQGAAASVLISIEQSPANFPLKVTA